MKATALSALALLVLAGGLPKQSGARGIGHRMPASGRFPF